MTEPLTPEEIETINDHSKGYHDGCPRCAARPSDEVTCPGCGRLVRYNDSRGGQHVPSTHRSRSPSEQAAYDAGRLAGYEEGIAAHPSDEVTGLDVERLALSIHAAHSHGRYLTMPDSEADEALARDIAREYAALANTKESDGG